MRRCFLCGLLVLSGIFVGLVYADDFHWTGNGDGKSWTDEFNWQEKGYPGEAGPNDRVFIVADSSDVSVDYDLAGFMQYNLLRLGSSSDDVFSSLTLLNNLYIGLIQAGFSHKGSIEQTAANVSTGQLYLGYTVGSYGEYRISQEAAKLSVNFNIIIGGGNNESTRHYGYFGQSDGTVSSGNVNIYAAAGGQSLYEIEDGTLDIGNLNLDLSRGAKFKQDGGTVSLTQALARGTVEITSGSMTTTGIFTLEASLYDDAFFNQSGGDVVMNNNLKIKPRNQHDAYYNLSGGTLTVNSIEQVGNEYGSSQEGTAYFNQTGGNHIVKNLYIGSSLNEKIFGEYNLSGNGILDVDNYFFVNPKGTFNQSNGEVHLEDVKYAYNSGVYNLSGGILFSSAGTHVHQQHAFENNGEVIQTGGLVDSGAKYILNKNRGEYVLDVPDNSGPAIKGISFVNAGKMFHKTGLIDVDVAVLNSGSYYGNGVVKSDFNNSGMFSPGKGFLNDERIGSFFIDGNWNGPGNGKTSTLFFDLAGYSQGQEYDFLHLTGDFYLFDSLFRVFLINGFDPLPGSVFDLVYAEGSIFYGDTSVDWTLPDLGPDKWWEVDVTDHYVSLQVEGKSSVVPEPGTFVLFFIGALLLFSRRSKIFA